MRDKRREELVEENMVLKAEKLRLEGLVLQLQQTVEALKLDNLNKQEIMFAITALAPEQARH